MDYNLLALTKKDEVIDGCSKVKRKNLNKIQQRRYELCKKLK